jgi:hypothetical protein
MNTRTAIDTDKESPTGENDSDEILTQGGYQLRWSSRPLLSLPAAYADLAATGSEGREKFTVYFPNRLMCSD